MARSGDPSRPDGWELPVAQALAEPVLMAGMPRDYAIAMFDLRLTGVALALCGSSSPEDQTLIDAVLERSGETGFAREFLKAKGVQNVDSVFDAFARPLAAE